MFTAAALAALVPGATVQGAAQAQAWRVHTDTRTVQPGDVFVALRGERFDAHDFLQDALDKGATVLVCQRGRGAVELPAGCARIDVDDTHAALSAMAQGWRAQLRGVPLIAVTGSNGKTTVTQMVASILRAAAGEACLATQGNLNNDIGVPLTLLRLRAQHRWAVVELGMNHPGEIAQLAALAQSDVALVNNAQREHQEFMHTVEAVARENGAVLQALPGAGVAVFPQADAFAPLWRSLAGAARCLGFGQASGGADVALEQAQWRDGAWQVQARVQGQRLVFALAIAGRHNVFNALAAAACAHAAGVPLEAIAQGLQAFEPVKGRSRALAVAVAGRALTLVDDSYNANPDSVRAAIDVLAELPGPGVLVLGDMGEVGDQGAAFHAEVGAYAQQRGIAEVLLLGELAAHACVGPARHFANLDALLAALMPLLAQAGSVLVKGSRFMRMERVVEAVQAAATPTKEGAC
ncbi:MAG: UDP-N-acetylmuramoyl-tripeptide--D-alanyl-D-alanine ligase [Rhodoferax sp.]